LTVPHGEYKLNIDGNILNLQLIGAFNEIGAQQFTSAMKASIKALNGQPFAILVNDLEVIGGTPEAYAELEEYNQWLNTQKLVAKAMVIISPITLAIVDKYAPSRNEQNIAVFNTEEPALIWLKEQLAQYNKANQSG